MNIFKWLAGGTQDFTKPESVNLKRREFFSAAAAAPVAVVAAKEALSAPRAAVMPTPDPPVHYQSHDAGFVCSASYIGTAGCGAYASGSWEPFLVRNHRGS
jgi:hypothetical protein